MGGREEPEHSGPGARVPLSSRTGFEPETCHSTFESIPSAPLRLTRTSHTGFRFDQPSSRTYLKVFLNTVAISVTYEIVIWSPSSGVIDY